MAENDDEPRDVAPPQGPLLTREVFLDTEAYRRVGFDTTRPSIAALISHVADERLELHTTDITLQEIKRQIAVEADKVVDEIQRALRTLDKWRARAPRALGKKTKGRKIDAAAVGEEAFDSFRHALAPFNVHRASEQDAKAIFEDYFARRPPFDGEGGKSVKEFPDAFVIANLNEWCRIEDTFMYVVTHDKAMLRAAEAHDRLIPVSTLEGLLQTVTLQHSPGVLQTVDVILDDPGFADQLNDAIDRSIGDLEVIYVGQLYDGEASDPQRAGDPRITKWTVISAFDKRYGVIIECELELLVQVGYEDLSMASYDNEDDVYIGGEAVTDEVEEEVSLRFFVNVDETGAVRRAEILTPEVTIYGPHDTYK